jgi:hypothetical protein
MSRRQLHPPRAALIIRPRVVKRRGNATHAQPRTAIDEELHKHLGRLDRRAHAAVFTLLELVADIDRPRATQLIEAMATIVAFATRTASRARRRNRRSR